MHALLGYLICLIVLTPAFSVDVFFALIGATSRLHDVLGVVRALSRVLQSVTSPFKIALALIVLVAAFASDSHRFTRGFILLAATTVGALGILETATVYPFVGSEQTLALLPWAAVTVLSFAGGARLTAAFPKRAAAVF